MAGQACIRGMRVPVSLVLNLVANGKTVTEIIEDYPYLEPDDIRQSLHYAAWLNQERVYWGKFQNSDLVEIEAITHLPCVVLLGEPGIGKSKTTDVAKTKLTPIIKQDGGDLIY